MSYTELFTLTNILQFVVVNLSIHVAAKTTTVDLSRVVQVNNAKHAYNYEFTRTASAIQCALLCNRNSSCNAASYTSNSSQCELSSVYSSNLNTQWVSGWTLYRMQRPFNNCSGNSCFVVDTVAKDWNTAKADCENLGGHLSYGKTQTKTDFVEELIRQLGASDLWMGASDLALEDRWVWSDGSLVSDGYSKWSLTEPNDQFGNENCMEMNLFSTLSGYAWNDIPCYLDRVSVCEYE